MKTNGKKTIAVVIYSNPDHYPPTINAINILARQFNVTVICRNICNSGIAVNYPSNVTVRRLGKYIEFGQHARQSRFFSLAEFALFILKTLWHVWKTRALLVYAYDAYGFVGGRVAALVRRLPIIYQNHDLIELKKATGTMRFLKLFELRFARKTDMIIFPELNRANIFAREAALMTTPVIVKNTPLTLKEMPADRLRTALSGRGYGPEEPVILYQGAIGPSHAIMEIIESIKYWGDSGIFVMLGYCSESYREDIFKKAETLGVQNRICLLPMVSYSELFSYTAGATVGMALYQSYDVNWRNIGGASNKVFEYLATGVPVVLSRSESTQRLLGDSQWGKLADPDSPFEIGTAVREWLEDGAHYAAARRAALEAHRLEFNYEKEFEPVRQFIYRTLYGN